MHCSFFFLLIFSLFGENERKRSVGLWPFILKGRMKKQMKRIGFGILVDRIWPRGVSKEKLEIAYWLKEVAPSSELRKWFSREPEKFEEFKKRYQEELEQVEENKVALENLKQIVTEK